MTENRKQDFSRIVERRRSAAIVTLDEEGIILSAGSTAEDILGLPASDLVGMHLSAALGSEVVEQYLKALARQIGIGGSMDQSTHVEIVSTNTSGSSRTLELSLVNRDDYNGILTAFIRDVTGQRDTERTLVELDHRYRLLFDRNLAGVYRATLDGRIFECNDACAKILGARSREHYLTGDAPPPWLAIEELTEMVERLQEEGHLFGVETGMLRRDGSPVWIVQNVSLIEHEPGGEPIIEGTMFDVTQKRLAEEKVDYQAHHDSLTGLANPVLFEHRVVEALEHARANERWAALLFLDIDNFKSVNDTLGHNIGNQLLQLAAYRLQKTLREGDTIARLGGDEFTAILPSLRHPDDARMVALKLLDQLSKPFLLDGREIAITASIGIALYPDDGADADTLMRNADIAMYRAKDLGRNNIQICSQATSVEAVERMTLENDLRMAIDRQEFVLFFQPQVDAVNGKIHALEALIRWNHPTRGLVMPIEFIPVAERSRMMVAIGRWVLGEACRTVARWNDLEPDLRVAVNVSPRQFQDENFVDSVRESLEGSNLDPRRLELEITEGVAMENPEAALEILGELKAMGVRISIDDFGTGYSSLSYLTKFPIDCLKIDQGFVQDIEKGGSESTIIAAVIALAHQLKLHVIAEGVETIAQSQFLVGQHCKEMQGFYFSRPQPFDEIDKLIRQR